MKLGWQGALERLREEFEVRETELEALRALDQHLLRRNASLDDTCRFVLGCVTRLLPVHYAQVWMRRHNRLELVAATPTGTTSNTLDLRDSVTGWCVLHGTPARIPNVRTDAHFRHLYKDFLGADVPKMLSELAVPIKINGATIGVLNVESPTENAFDEHQEAVLQTLAGQTAIAFANVQLFNEAELFNALRPHFLFEKHTTEVDIQLILNKALSELTAYLGQVTHFQLLFCDDDERLVVAYTSSGKDKNVRVDIANSVSGEAVLARAPIIVRDVRAHPKYVGMLGETIKSEMAVPIIVQDEVTGVLNFESEEIGIFDDFSEVIVQHFSTQMAWLLTLLKLRFDLGTQMRADRANGILQAMGDQTGNLVHKLKNIVGPIKLQAEELQLHHTIVLAANPQIAQLIENIRKRAEDALVLPNQMRKLFIELDNLDVNVVIQDTVRQFSDLDKIHILTSITKALPRVRCQGLGAALHTLIENAIDAMPNGGEIVVSSSTVTFHNLKDQFVEISVKDQGTGISPEHLDRIFEWGFSTKAKEQKGLGWGLGWVKTFVDRSHGSVSVESALGQGSTFRLRFPAVTIDSGMGT
jgi:signal transduction histidine kinase